MARISAWEHLKPEIEAEFRSGKQPIEVYGAYPAVPRGTIREWFKPFRQDSANDSANLKPATRADVEVLPPRSSLVALEGGQQQSDIALARRTLRAIAKDSDVSPAVQVQAALGLMKLACLRHELPKHILEETEESRLEDERDRIRDLPPEEIARRIREALG